MIATHQKGKGESQFLKKKLEGKEKNSDWGQWQRFTSTSGITIPNNILVCVCDPIASPQTHNPFDLQNSNNKLELTKTNYTEQRHTFFNALSSLNEQPKVSN